MSKWILPIHFLRLCWFTFLCLTYKNACCKCYSQNNVTERTRDASISVKTCGSWYTTKMFWFLIFEPRFPIFRRQQLLDYDLLLKDATCFHLLESWTIRSNLPCFFPCLVGVFLPCLIGICLFTRVNQKKEWHKMPCSLVAALLLWWCRTSCWWHISAGPYQSIGLMVFILTTISLTPEGSILETGSSFSKHYSFNLLSRSSGICKHTCSAVHISFVKIFIFPWKMHPCFFNLYMHPLIRIFSSRI